MPHLGIHAPGWLEARTQPEDRGHATPCLIWTKTTTPKGYGRTRHRGRMIYAHRAAWALRNGEPDDTLDVDHLCRVHSCCNVDHLQLVPHVVNVRRGLSTVLTMKQAQEAKHSGRPPQEEADRLGVSVWTIYDLRSGRTWREL